MSKLPEIRKRLSAATPGPWELYREDDWQGQCRRLDANGDTLMSDQRYYPWCPNKEDDWQLIANAPTDIAHLLALLERCVPWLESLVIHHDDQMIQLAFIDELKALITEIKGAG